MKTIIIFVNSTSDARWATSYTHNHPSQKVLLIAPIFAAQQELKKNGLDHYLYYRNPLFNKDFYRFGVPSLTKEVQQYISQIEKFFLHIRILNTPIMELLKIRLETEFLSILFSFRYLKILNELYKPDFFYIPSNTHDELGSWSPQFFKLPHLARKFFLNKKEYVEYSSDDSEVIEISRFLRVFNFISGIITKLYFLVLNLKFRNSYEVNVKKIDFLLFSAGFNLYYYRQTIPLLLKKYNGVILTGEQSLEDEYMLHASQIPFIPLKFFWNKSLKDKQNEIYIRIKNQLSIIFNNPQNLIVKSYLSKDLQMAFISAFQAISEKYLLQCIKQTLLADEVLKCYSPRLVITTHDPAPSAIPFVSQAKSLKKSTLVLLHGWNEITLGANHLSDTIIVWGDFIKSWYKRVLKKNSNSLHVGGFPFLDNFNKSGSSYHNAGILKKNITFGLLLTLYPPNNYHQSLFLEQLLQSAKKYRFKGQFVIRTHSGQEVSEINQLSKQYGIKMYVSHIKPLDFFVRACDVLLTWDTTAMFLPMIHDKPLFYTTPLWGQGMMPVKKFGGAWIVKKSDDIFIKLRRVKNEPKLLVKLNVEQKTFLKKVGGVNEVSASVRTAKIIDRLMVK